MDIKKELILIGTKVQNVEEVIEQLEQDLSENERRKINIIKKMHLFKVVKLVNIFKNLLEQKTFEKFNLDKLELFHYYSMNNDKNYDMNFSFYTQEDEKFDFFSYKDGKFEHKSNDLKKFTSALINLYNTDFLIENVNEHFYALKNHKEIITLDENGMKKLFNILLSEELRKNYDYSQLDVALNEKNYEKVRNKL